jgi:hypothetical protein
MRRAANPRHSLRRASRYIYYVLQTPKGKAADEPRRSILSAIGSCTLVLYYWPHCNRERITNSETTSYAQRNLNTVLLRYHLEYVLLSRLQTVSLTVLRYTAIRERLRQLFPAKRTLLTFAADAYISRPSLQVRRLFSVCRGENARRKRQPLGGAPLPMLWWASVLTSIDDDSHDSSIRRSWLSKSLPVKS